MHIRWNKVGQRMSQTNESLFQVNGNLQSRNRGRCRGRTNQEEQVETATHLDGVKVLARRKSPSTLQKTKGCIPLNSCCRWPTTQMAFVPLPRKFALTSPQLYGVNKSTPNPVPVANGVYVALWNSLDGRKNHTKRGTAIKPDWQVMTQEWDRTTLWTGEWWQSGRDCPKWILWTMS